MRVIVMGCGRVGSAVASLLSAEGQELCVLDRDSDARDRLPANFRGQFLVGNGFNRQLLEQAGIARTDAFVAVSAGDNTNIVSARIAKEDFRVPLVVARIYDPRRADIYRDLGIPTVGSVRWTANRIHQMLLHRRLDPELLFGNGETMIVRQTLPAWLAGRPAHHLDVDGEIRVVEITRAGSSFIPTSDSLVESEDSASFVVAAGALGRLRGFLDQELGG